MVLFGRSFICFRHAPALLLAGFITVGCAGTTKVDTALETRMTEMFRAVYSEIEAVHIDPLDASKFTIAGMEGLRSVDPTITHHYDGGVLSLKIDDETVARSALPDPTSPMEEWALTSRNLIMEARTTATLLATADEEAIYESFIDSALKTLDRYSRYANPRDASELRAERQGFGGIGIDYEMHPDGVRIIAMDAGKPAELAGIRIGDRIVAIDTIRIAGDSLRKVQERIRGPVETEVILQIVRAGSSDPLTITVTRTRIVPNTVHLSELGNHALIRVTSFNELTADRMAQATKDAQTSIGPKLSGLILDLRGNLGGLLDQSIDAADLFLDHGIISLADGRHKDSHQRFEADESLIADTVPLVVLINGTTASAAEILAAALQDQGRAVVVGMSSFGKGSIQTVIDMPNGGELYVTWARFVAPSGYPLEKLGVMPTICTSAASDAVAALDTALGNGPDGGWEMLHRRRNVDMHNADEVGDTLKLCPWRPHASGDIDLGIAELLLDSPALFKRALEIGRAGTGA